jgi:hypothetical protein
MARASSIKLHQGLSPAFHVSSILFLACERPTVRTTLDHIPRKQKASVRKAEMRFVFCPSLRALLAAAYRRFFR